MRERWVFGPSNCALQNISIIHGEISCSLSKFFTASAAEWGYAFCFHLDTSQFLMHSKPWNCHVQLVLFPPPY